MTAAEQSLVSRWATYCGPQEDADGGTIELFNLTQAIEGRPVGSTIALQTLLAAIGPVEDAK